MQGGTARLEFAGALKDEFGFGRGKQMGSDTLKARPEQTWFWNLRLHIEGCAIAGKSPYEPDPAKTGVEACRWHRGGPPDRKSGRERFSWSLPIRKTCKIEKKLPGTHAVTETAPKRQIPADQD
jgi:hypothetical protein